MFVWRVAKTGYQWFTEDNDEPLDIAVFRKKPQSAWPECHLEPVSESFREYKPLSTPCLFRRFADTEIEPDAILAFANQYGPLGAEPAEFGPDFDLHGYDENDTSEFGHARTPKQVISRAEDASLFVRQFDSLSLWVQSIKEMRRCVRDLEKRGKAEERPAYVQRTIDFVNMRLLHEDVRMSFDEDVVGKGVYELKPRPASLLTALWIQLGMYVSENRSWRQCPVCNKWFGIGSEEGDSRTSRRYCEDACKSQAYRNRKRRP